MSFCNLKKIFSSAELCVSAPLTFVGWFFSQENNVVLSSVNRFTFTKEKVKRSLQKSVESDGKSVTENIKASDVLWF